MSRHLTTGQRAHAALALLEYEREQAKARQREGQERGRAVQQGAVGTEFSTNRTKALDEAGARFGVSRDSVNKARALDAKRPDLAEKVAA